MTLERVEQGDRLSAARQNLLIEQVNGLARPGTAGRAQYGASGITFDGAAETRLALFELTTALAYPNLVGAPSTHFDREPMPSARARRVWCHWFSSADQDAEEKPIPTWRTVADDAEIVIWHVTAYRDCNGYAIGTAAFSAGDRLWGQWNRQSGRWEILAQPLGLCRFELLSGLSPGGSALATLLSYSGGSYQAGVEITVYDALQATLSGRAKSDTLVGSRGYAVYMPDSSHWEILQMWDQAKRCNARVAGAMAKTDLTHFVNNVVPTDSGWSPVSSPSQTISVANTMGWESDDGSECKIEWNTSAAQWELYQARCKGT
jgi:hypothetical protein